MTVLAYSFGNGEAFGFMEQRDRGQHEYIDNDYEEENSYPLSKKEMEETKARFFSFIEKLEQKVEEFSASSLPELVEMNQTDTDEYKRSYQRMKAAVIGQLDNMQQKALEVKNEKIS